MTIKEMHIEFSQSTQNISAALKRKAIPEQIDWILNKCQERFIDLQIEIQDSGAANILNISAISTLLKNYKTDAEQLEDRVRVIIPEDIRHVLNDSSLVKNLCGGSVLPTIQQVTNLLFLKFPNSTGTGSPLKYYVTVALNVGAKSIALNNVKTLFNSSYTGMSSAEQKQEIVEALLWYMRNVENITVYWERYGNIYKPDTFIFPGQTTGSLVCDGAASVTGTTISVTYPIHTSVTGVWAPNRLVTIKNRSTMLSTPFVTSTHISPLSVLQGNYLYVDVSKGFTVSRVEIDYIKNPRRMSLSLNQHCELPNGVHQSVCDLAAEYFKAITEDPNWEVKLADNMRRSPTLK